MTDFQQTENPSRIGQQRLSSARDGETDRCRAVLIGNEFRREFQSLVGWIRRNTQVVGSFRTIGEAVESRRLNEDASDLAIVLQSWSDEYAAGDVNELIGRTLFRRLVCCFGAACESDGRNRAVWPAATRISVPLAGSVIASEILRLTDGEEAIPPTAAADEIFSYRMCGNQNGGVPVNPDGRNGAVVSPDAALRRTMVTALKEQGLMSLGLPLITVSGKHPVRQKETSRGPVHIVLHDLDPWGAPVADSLTAVRRMFPSAVILGLAGLPNAGLAVEIADQKLAGIVPKLDLENGLRQHLSRLTAVQKPTADIR